MRAPKSTQPAKHADHIVLVGKVVTVKAGTVPTSPDSAQHTDMKSVARAMKVVSQSAAFDHIGYDSGK